jgi:GxxExxY protein
MNWAMGCGKRPTRGRCVVNLSCKGLSIPNRRYILSFYKDQKVDDSIPDLVVEERIVVDTKTVDTIGENEIRQMLNYLRVTGLKVGILLNFKKSKLEWKRVVLSKH